VGEVIRNARVEHGLTVYDVERRSGGRFKPSSLGGYERGERSISLQRFCQLSEVYGIPADRLLREVLERIKRGSREGVIVDLRELSEVDEGLPPT
jgi:transcriptional regulator with XRE-family HTH domain